MAMDENAMFKALLKNKPQPKPLTNEIKQAPAQPSRPPASAAKGSEDAMFKALLHNRPAPPAQKPQARVEPRLEPVQQAAYVQEPAVITRVSQPPVVTMEPVVDSINDLTVSVNQIHGLMKTIVLPVMILILLVGIGILIKIS